jgi:hypothetical protein
LEEEAVKRALTTVVFALIAGALALPFGDGRHPNYPTKLEVIPRHGDYPVQSPVAARRDAGPQKLACLTPAPRKPQHRVG